MKSLCRTIPIPLCLIALLGLPLADSGSQGQDELLARIRRVETGIVAVDSRTDAGTTTITDRMVRTGIPGVSLTVIHDGRIEWAKAYGVREAGKTEPVTPRTLFQAASISKPVAAAGALRLAQDGLLQLDEDVNQQLVMWKVPENEFTRSKKVTLRGILTHSAGLTVHGFPGYAAGGQVPGLLQVLDGIEPANSAPIRVDTEPGMKSRYSGGGFCVLQQLIIDLTGKPFAQFMRDTVLARLGMRDSAYEQPLPPGLQERAAAGHRADGTVIEGKFHIYPEMAAAGLWTTPSDLASFAIELQEARAGISHRLLSQETATDMLTPRFDGRGLGIRVLGEGRSARFEHGGSNAGFRCQMVAMMETGDGAVVMTNSDAGAVLAAEIIRSIAKEYRWPEVQQRP